MSSSVNGRSMRQRRSMPAVDNCCTAVLLWALTGVGLSEIVNLKRDEIGGIGKDGATARLEDSKTGRARSGSDRKR